MPLDRTTRWIATLHVRPLPARTGGLDGNAGAYAIVLALAEDEVDYREKVTAEMESLGLFIAEIESARPYEPHPAIAESVRLCAAHLSPEWPVQYRDFDTYPNDDA